MTAKATVTAKSEPEPDVIFDDEQTGPHRRITLAALEWAHVLDFARSVVKHRVPPEPVMQSIRFLEDQLCNAGAGVTPGWYKDKEITIEMHYKVVGFWKMIFSNHAKKEVHGVEAFKKKIGGMRV
jgi:hypothetical protein